MTAESRTPLPTNDGSRLQLSSVREQDVLKDLLEIIRQLMGLLGGHPDSLPEDPNAAMEAVVAQYDQFGPPQGLSFVQAAVARSLVLGAYVALQQAAPELDSSAVAHFAAMLENLYADLGGAPN